MECKGKAFWDGIGFIMAKAGEREGSRQCEGGKIVVKMGIKSIKRIDHVQVSVSQYIY